MCIVQSDDQGLVNTDPRTIAVPDGFVNMIPTDVRGLTFSRTPQQVSVMLLACLCWSPGSFHSYVSNMLGGGRGNKSSTRC